MSTLPTTPAHVETSVAKRRPAPAALSAPSPWWRLAIGVALVAIALQLMALAQLARQQVQRGVQLRHAIAALPAAPQGREPGAAAAQAQAQLRSNAMVRTASAARADRGAGSGPLPASSVYALR